MNFVELCEKIRDIGVSSVANEDFDPKELDLTCVHSVGGHEGAGEHAERVFEHDNNGEKIFVKIEGYYSSYEGTEWESSIDLVTPREKVITVYE
jgi:hypothetical protein